MDPKELTELFKPKETAEEGRSQADKNSLKIAYEELSNRTGIPERCFDYRAVSEQNAVTRAPSESIGARFYLTAGGFHCSHWVCFVRVGLEEARLENIAESLSRKFDGACTTLVLFATQLDWTVYRILFSKGHLEDARMIASIFDAVDKIESEPSLGNFISFSRSFNKFPLSQLKTATSLALPKPFILLAGISGTGKSRFVDKQAMASRFDRDVKNFCLIPVRPDWHEPADLLGYKSRIDGEKYVCTEFLKFVAKAWCDAVNDEGEILSLQEMTTHWACLDEMNLAPVEQYFADFLSVMETRRFVSGVYHCAPLVRASEIRSLRSEAREQLKQHLFEDEANSKKGNRLFDLFMSHPDFDGIPIPPNLVVAGTVNMDETTHGFSRKVIDRAFTIDFQEFYPNDFQCYLHKESPRFRTLLLPFATDSREETVSAALGATADPTGERTVDFLETINTVLRDTPFELAFRALNEALLSVACFAGHTSSFEGEGAGIVVTAGDDVGAELEVLSATTVQANPFADLTLLAAWDDFMMQKVLPRIDGDTAKLRPLREIEGLTIDLPPAFGRDSLLHQLYGLLAINLRPIWGDESDQDYESAKASPTRPDLLREIHTPKAIPCRSRKKLRWMMRRLKANQFTDFWC